MNVVAEILYLMKIGNVWEILAENLTPLLNSIWSLIVVLFT